ncbi:hypothetical protein HNR27_000933 [Ornithinibacillus bavariensis]
MLAAFVLLFVWFVIFTPIILLIALLAALT